MTIHKNIHFDNNATTPLSEGALKAVIEALEAIPGNPSSITSRGRYAKGKILTARKDIANFLKSHPEEIFFTSGGTESIQTLIQGICAKRSGPIITTSIEHNAVLGCTEKLDKILLDTRSPDIYCIEEIESSLQKGAAAIILSLVNGETGAILPIEKIARLAKQYTTPLIIDGVAALGKMPIQLHEGITAMAFSGHKIHGPKGSGFCFIKKGTPFSPLLTGGKQEHNLRAGTENTPAILGLAQAVKEIHVDTYSYLKNLRDYFEIEIQKVFPTSSIHKAPLRICNVSNIHFEDIDGDHLLIYLDQNNIAVSLGSACSSGSLEPSHVLLGLGYSRRHASSSIRFSFSKQNTKEEVDQLIKVLHMYQSFLKESLINYTF
ncbi:MAG: Cysteine desulfurase NifS [Chlamydiia bacterium]|nr:Cysteine desulfurase NifS [Chlamydiia bacterium]MCH9618155.1 Cysteine desulfurase NifS [Chlamydiia bacterium]MCH9624035.1 Cysteine desulfurase NifS [Chlamydiia bacterium]